MTRVLRRLLSLAASGLCLLSLLASVGAGWLWGRSYRTPTAVEFPWAGGRWEVALQRGKVGADNEPQRRLERERESRRRAQVFGECVRLSQQYDALRLRLRTAGAGERDAIRAEMGRVKAAADVN